MQDSITYKNAPLIELIVELRWDVKTVEIPGIPSYINDDASIFEEWFNQFSSRLEGLGYLNLERLLPREIPAMAYQPIFRYKKKRDLPFPVVQFGHGIFTINAGPPDYISWARFRPEIEAGIKALLESKPSGEDQNKFKLASVRYIDAFFETLKQEASDFAFMKDSLNATVHLPQEVFDLAENIDDISSTIALRFPVKGQPNTQLTLQIGAASFDKKPATMMDMNYISTTEIPMDIDNTLRFLDGARGTLHDIFETMTSRIKDRMNPAAN